MVYNQGIIQQINKATFYQLVEGRCLGLNDGAIGLNLHMPVIVGLLEQRKLYLINEFNAQLHSPGLY